MSTLFQGTGNYVVFAILKIHLYVFEIHLFQSLKPCDMYGTLPKCYFKKLLKSGCKFWSQKWKYQVTFLFVIITNFVYARFDSVADSLTGKISPNPCIGKNLKNSQLGNDMSFHKIFSWNSNLHIPKHWWLHGFQLTVNL